MHPMFTDQIASDRMAELRREADNRRMVHELLANSERTRTSRRGWTRAREALRRLRPAAA